MAVQTQIQTRRGTAATWTSTNPTLAAGEIGFETDTNKFKIGTGSTAWTALAYAANTSPLTTKGDLYTYSTTNDRLPVGANGETIVADSSTSTGLRYQSNFAAGKNKIINGDFGIWQRGTTFTNPNAVYLADRWTCTVAIAIPTWTISQQTFTPGTAPVAGYEGQYFMRAQVTAFGSSTAQSFRQKIEDVRTFAGQTVTLSFWAKADSTRTIINPTFQQDFGSGGSGAVVTGVTGVVSLTTSWQRFSSTLAIPSISGKTIGTNSTLIVDINTPGAANYTMDIWGVQLEASNTATAFQTATGTIQGELAACQRYYQRSTSGTPYGNVTPQGFAKSTTQTFVSYPMKVTLRAAATTVEYANIGFDDGYSGIQAVTNVGIAASNPDCVTLLFTGTGLTTSRPYQMIANNNSAGYLAIGAEI